MRPLSKRPATGAGHDRPPGDARQPRGTFRRRRRAGGWGTGGGTGADAQAVGGEGRGRRFGMATAALGVALVGVLGVLTGTAYAYFTSSGSGTGQAATGSLAPLTITAAGTPSTVLVPASTADLVFTVTNPNAFPVTITAIARGAGSVAVTATKTAAGCHATDATVSFNAGVALGTVSPITLPPGTTTVHVAHGAAMGASSASACQHAVFTIPVSLTVQQ